MPEKSRVDPVRAASQTLLLTVCAALCACANEINVGDARDSEHVREDEELARVARELEGSWQGPLLGMRGELTFTASAKPRSGDFSVNCPNINECNPFASLFDEPDDDGAPSGMSAQLSGRYELVAKIGEDLFLCVFTSSDAARSRTANLWSSPGGGELEFSLPGATSLAARFERK